MENNDIKLSTGSEDSVKKENVFTKKVKPMSKTEYFFISLGNSLKKAGLWILDFIVSIFLSLWNCLKIAGIGIVKAGYGIYRFFYRKVRQFKYNDWSGRVSFFLFGTSNFKHGQWFNGIFLLLLEIGFIIYMAVPNGGMFQLIGLFTLGTVKTTPGNEIEDAVLGDNSVIFLILGIVSVLIIIAFFVLWNKSIEEGYKNYRIDNFIKYKDLFKRTEDFAEQIDADVQEAFKANVKQGDFKKANKKRIDDFVLSLETNDPKFNDFVKFVINETIFDAYMYARKIKKEENKLAKLNEKLEKFDAQIELKRAANTEKWTAMSEEMGNTEEAKEKIEILSDKFDNKVLSQSTERLHNIQKQQNNITQIVKTHANSCAVLGKQNNDKYGRYNRYYTNVADYDALIKFYNNYDKFVSKYNDSLGGSESKNAENVEEIAKITTIKDEKLAATKEKFAGIRAKKADLLAQLKAAELENKTQVKAVQADASLSIEDRQMRLADLKEQEIEFSTRLKGALYDLPNDKAINAMEKEELKETTHAFKRDKKYLKTNFTPETFAKEEVINMMILDFKMPYQEAVYFESLLFVKENKEQRFLTSEELEHKLQETIDSKNAYLEKHEHKFDGKGETFKEQMKSLLDDKFHMTILFLPLLGILVFSVLPLIFSVLIAFTNFNSDISIPADMFDWIGFQNFHDLFFGAAGDTLNVTPAQLGKSLSWTLIWAVCATFSNYFLGIIVALMINKDGIKFKGLWRTIFVLSIAIPSFITLTTLSQMVNSGGFLAEIFNLNFGAKDNPMTGAWATKFIIILINIWVGIPYTILSTTGILLNIPKDLYESSEVDGAGAFTKFMKITMPYIFFVTGPYLITTFIGNINNFNVIFFLSNGQPVLGSAAIGETDLLITAIYKLVMTNNDSALASTIGIFVFIICSFFSIIMYNKSGAIQQEDQFQ